VARRAISLLLKKRGFVVSEAATVAQAMREITRQPRWVLLDVMLPDGSGLEVLRRIKSEGLPIKVCVITGCHEHVLNQARALGAEYAFAKPLQIEQLVAAMTQ
jgi:CheY-like chemotaxis protein